MNLSRKEFLLLSVSFVGVGLLGCGGDEVANPDLATGGTTGCLKNGTNSVIGANHGHVLMVAIADIQAGVDKTYAIMGSSPHAHSVTLTAAHFADLAANKPVSATSTTNAQHEHSIMITCA